MSLDDLRAFAAAGRFDAVLRTALRMAGDDPALTTFRNGAAALKRNDAFAAVAAFEALQRIDPAFPALDDALASAYRRDARYEDCLKTAGTGRQSLYEKGLSLLALGRAGEALDTFDVILGTDPGHAASWFASHAPALELHGMAEASRRLGQACALQGEAGKYRGFTAAYALLSGGGAVEPGPHPASRALVEGVQALLPHCPVPPRLFGLSASLLRFAMDEAKEEGLVLEFGVRRGTSTTVLGEAAGQAVHGFDSFEGLPQSWGSEPAGVLTTGASLPKVPDNVTLHAGWFEDTLDPFLTAHPGPVRLVNVDSDIYASARFVLGKLAPRIRPGTVLVFDEFIGNRSWAEDEFKAFAEYVAENGVGWRVLAAAPVTKQVAVVIDDA